MTYSLLCLGLPMLLLSSLPIHSKSFINRSTTASSARKINTTLQMSSSAPTAKDIIKRIFCYGDSLTAGTAPPSDQLFPYGPHLEKELNYNLLEGDQAVMVRWRGLPGWTASTLVDYVSDGSVGLQSAVMGIRDPSLSLVIILAGTNDIGALTSSMGGSNNIDANEAIEPILSLHNACLNCEGDGGKKMYTRLLSVYREVVGRR